MKEVVVSGKLFELFLSSEKIKERVESLAQEINNYYEEVYESPVHVIVMMNGAFFFGADLIRLLDFPLHMYFVKASSYVGMESTGEVSFKLPEGLQIKDKRVLVIEDIVDTGKTITAFRKVLDKECPREVKIASLLTKNINPKVVDTVDFKGFNVENKFVIGYGLDLDGMARDFKDIYKLKKK